MTQPDVAEAAHPHKKVEITVIHEDSGRDTKVEIEAAEKVTVETVIDRAYKKLHQERQVGDRLRCECSGESVFAHSTETIEQFLREQEGCTTWLFAGPTGGA